MSSRSGELDFADQLRSGRTTGNAVEMSGEFIGPELKWRRGVALQTRARWGVGYVMVAEAGDHCGTRVGPTRHHAPAMGGFPQWSHRANPSANVTRGRHPR